jgi:AraC-like DNA-binding protein
VRTSKPTPVPLVVFCLPPPYDRFQAVRDPAALTADDLPEASLLALGVTAPREEWAAVAELVPWLRARCPSAPLVLRVRRRPIAEDLDWARRAGALRVRAVLFEGEPPRPRLQRALTEAVGLPEDLGEWLLLREPSLAPAVVHLVRDIVRLAPTYQDVGLLLARLGRAERTVRTWFQHAGIPGPGKWLALAHAIYAALRLQRDRRDPLLTVAVESGYSDHSSLSRQSLRLFGVRPGAIRDTLGWEWLLERWLRRVSGEAGSGRFAHRSAATSPILSIRSYSPGEQLVEAARPDGVVTIT